MNVNIGELYPKQKEFCKATNKYICYGGARGGGKSYVVRIKLMLLALYYPGIQILLLRRTLKELRENHIMQLQKLLKDIAQYKESTKEFIFPNGSRIVLGYMDSEKDVLQYQGQSYEVIVMEEATMFTEFQFTTLTECNRLSGNMNKPFSPRMYFTCNPGGVGHMWVKRLFIDRQYKPTENPKDYKFIPSLVFDNKFIMENDPEYVKKLENLPEDRRKAMLYGDWNVFEGQFFTEWNTDVHVIEPFEIPSTWNKYIALDYGLDMFAVVFVAIDTRGKAYVYKEIYKPDLIVSDACQVLKSTMRKERFKAIFAPPDLWNRNRDTGMSTFEVFLKNGVFLTKAGNKREHGWLMVKEWLKPYKRRNEQTGLTMMDSDLKIFSNCYNLIRCLPELQHDDKNPNDVATEPHEITHIPDALRYFCVEHTSPTAERNSLFYITNFKHEEQVRYGDVGEEIHPI